jgi:RNA polymerase sigma factor (sigma-70 family)
MAVAGTAATDDQLVAAIRDGSDEALEALFLRYKDRIGAYVRGIVADQGKAEDIVQETFISAMRSLRSTEQQIAFRPWIYQIARNACIDQLRRQKRATEISLDSDAFKVQDEGRISQSRPSTHSEVARREDMHALRQAFGGLPDTQHEALVMRELEGLSYTEIAKRMNVSPAAVESMLFRARRGLKVEYDEIATGERCRRMQPLIAAVAEGMGGARDRQVLARHVRFCVSCRREATAMGLRPFVTEALRRGRIKRALHKVASLVPIPLFLRRRRGEGAPDASLVDRLGARMQAPFAQFGVAGGPAADNAAGAVSKAVAVVAAVALIGGGGLAGRSSHDASASARTPGGGAALSGPGLPGQPPATGIGGQTALSPFGPAAGLVASGQQAASGQTISAGQGGLIGLGSPTGAVGGGVPSGSGNPLSPILGGGGLLGGGGKGGGLLGGSGGLLGGGSSSGSTSPSTGEIGDTVNRILPRSVGGISLPSLGGGASGSGGGSGSSSGGGSTVGKVIDQVEKALPDATKIVPRSGGGTGGSGSGSPSTPSQPSTPTSPTTTLPSIPQIQQVPQQLQQAVPVPAPQLPSLPVTGLPLG